MSLRLLTILRPPDLPETDTPDSHRAYFWRLSRYHLNVSLTVAVLVILSGVALTPIGFARSNAVSDKINTELTPVKADIIAVQNGMKQISEAQSWNGKLLRRALANSLASDMRFLKSRRCKDTEERDRIQYDAEIENKQHEYRELQGFPYSVPGCSEL